MSQRIKPGPISKTCEICLDPFWCETARRHTARFCSMRCTAKARRAGRIASNRKTYRGKALQPWTCAEDETIRTRYASEGPRGLSGILGRSQRDLIRRARSLGVQKPGGRRWTIDEDAWLSDHVTKLRWSDLARRLHRSVPSVQVRAKVLGLRRVMGDGRLTPMALAEICGVARETVYRWITFGLEAHQNPAESGRGTFLIDPWEFRWWLKENPGAVDLRKVRQESFLDLLLGNLKASHEVSRLQAVMEEAS